jgi:hypothetical protein
MDEFGFSTELVDERCGPGLMSSVCILSSSLARGIS